MLEDYGLGIVEWKFSLRKPEYKIRVFCYKRLEWF